MKYKFTLYLAGMGPYSQAALRNLTSICEETILGEYELIIIDVVSHPELAEEAKILAAPTLIKQLPDPVAKIIGDMSDRDQIKVYLGLVPLRHTDESGHE